MAGITRDFSQEAVKKIQQLIKTNEEDGQWGIFDWFEDLFTSPGDIRDSLNNIEDYHREVIDDQNIGADKFDTVLRNVESVDNDYKSHMNVLKEKMVAYNEKVKTISALITPSVISAEPWQVNQIISEMNQAYNKSLDMLTYGDEVDGLYGGNQSSPINNLKTNEKIEEIIKQHYPEYSSKEIEALLKRLENEGCGYVALVNTIFEQYKDKPDEFEKKFGFPMYYIGENGKKIPNFDYLIVDFYCAIDNRNGKGKLNSMEDYDGEVDGSKNSYDLKLDVTGNGTSPQSREQRLEKYLKDHGIKVDVKENNTSASADEYDRLSGNGQVVIRVSPVKMYYPNGQPYGPQDGGHAMTVTGKDKAGNLIVSSWGQKFIIKPEDYPVPGYENSSTSMQAVVYE